jgi:rRNA-processing protein FCF1
LADTSLLPRDFDKKSADNMILSVALKYKSENPIILTSDNGLQLKAKILKISTVNLKEFHLR